MDCKKGERVKHPKKSDWGIGQVLADSEGGVVKVFFTHAGGKFIALDVIQPVKVSGEEAVSVILDSLDFSDTERKDKAACKNCGGPTQFGATSNSKRFSLGWCEPCFRHNRRTFQDRTTGLTHYFDELRTIDCVKSRYSPR